MAITNTYNIRISGLSLAACFLLTALQLKAQTGCQTFTTVASANRNYIKTSVPRRPGVDPAAAGLTTCDMMQTVQYFDGLGRPLQTVQVMGSPLKKDLVQPVAYDAFGREAITYQPYAAATANGSYKTTAVSDQLSFYSIPPAGVSSNFYPLQVSGFEPSPLNRVTEQGAPGAAWQPIDAGIIGSGHTSKKVYGTNNETAVTDTANSTLVPFYNISAINATTQQPTLAKTGNYKAGELYMVVSKDENWKSGRGGTVEEYKNKEGRVVLKRTFNYTGGTLQKLSTYYVYDDFGNMVYILPPLSNADNILPVQTQLDALCFQYRYDNRNRLTQKKIPGKGWELIVYNKLDQVVATQDANQRGKTTPEWTVSRYDAIGRVVMSGTYIYGATGADVRATVQTQANGFTTLWETPTGTAANYGYTAATFPASVSTVLSVNYYDNYTFAGTNPYPVSGNNKANGLVTGSLINVLGTTNMLWTVIYYDDRGRNIEMFKQHYLGAITSPYNYDDVINSYNFNDQLATVTRKHYTKNAGNTAATLALTIANTYDYDHIGRKINAFEKINTGNNILLSKYDYNEVGQVLSKHLHGATGAAPFLQDIDYAYNERGWLSRINNPAVTTKIFAMTLSYNSGASPQYNGNISGASWLTKVPAGLGLTQNLQSYAYSYDQINRLQQAAYTTPGYIGKFNEQFSYDNGGNISLLKRTNTTTAGQYLNNFTYDYTTGGAGNKLYGVTDAGTANQGGTYTYDLNGNTKTDTRNQITDIAYNVLNLPQVVTRTAGTIAYTYDAAGTKLRKISGSNTRDYINGIEYYNGTIESVGTEEGRAVASSGVYSYEYYLKDHLGNIRASVRQDGSIGQVQDYYAFGLEMNPGNSYTASPVNQHKYNGKEKQEETGQYDYGARFYDPVIGRWNTVDGMAEKYVSSSPYHYAANNPVSNYDIDGNKFSDAAWKEVNKLIADIDSRQADNNKDISNLQAKLSAGGLTEKEMKKINGKIGDLQQNNADLEQVRGETATLAAQDQVYNVVESDQLSTNEFNLAGTLFNTVSRAVDIVLPTTGGGLNLFAHELKHAFQFHMGTTSLSTYDGNSINTLGDFFAYDKQDEIEAYRRQGLFGSTYRSLPSYYDNRPQGPVNVLDIQAINYFNEQPIGVRHAELQKMAQRLKVAFTVSNETYAPN